MMIYRATSLFLASLVACTAIPLGAQGLRMPAGPAATPAAAAVGTSTPGAAQRSADYIVAVVNTEPQFIEFA